MDSFKTVGKLESKEYAFNFDLERMGIIDAVRSDMLDGRSFRTIHAERGELNIYGMPSQVIPPTECIFIDPLPPKDQHRT